MLQPEAVNMLNTFSRVLRSIFPDRKLSVSGEEEIEVLIENQDGAPLLLFQVDTNSLELRFGGNLYQNVETQYEWATLTELLLLFISLVYPIYADRLTISKFLSAILGLRVRNWADLLGRLLFGLSVPTSKVGNTFFIDQFSLKVDSHYVQLDGPFSARREYASELSICKSVLYYFSVILQSLDLEVILWDDDSSIISEVPDTSSAAPSPSDANTDIDIDVSDSELEAPSPSDSPDELGLDLEGETE